MAEGAETVTVSGTTSDLSIDPATVTITDDDATPTKVILSVNPATVNEDDPSTQIRVTGTLDGAALTTATEVTVSVGAGTDSAAEGTDYTTVNNFTLTIDANAMEGSATFDLVPTDDEVAEGAETVTVSGTTSDLTVDPATVTIIDNDAPAAQQRVKLSMSGDSEWVMEDAGPTNVTVKAELTGETRDKQTRVDVQLHPHEASADDFDAERENFEILIPVNQKSASHTFRFTPIDDEEEERDENLLFTGDTGEGNIPVDPTTLMIKDNDRGNGDNGGDDDDGDDDGDDDDGDGDDDDGDDDGDDDDGDDDGDDDSGSDDDAGSGPPRFVNARYVLDLPEHQDGRETPVRLGAVTARDPDGQPLTYALATGDGTRFRVATSSGAFTYVGPGENLDAGPPRYELTVTARDTDRQTASVAVQVNVIDVPEAPVAVADAAETREDEPAVIDVLANDRDPDGDSLRVVGVGAPEHGTVSVVSGGVQYTPSLNYHGRDRFRYTVADPGGLTATATVTVTVTPVNEPPDAVDDEAETLEDEPVLVDVLANDTDVDGDGLRVVTATAPAHGTTTVEAGGVRYSPAGDYHGPDRFRYTVADPGGLTDTAIVTLTVQPVNDAPAPVGVIPEQALEEGGEPAALDLTPYFTDVDGDALTFTAVSSDPSATTVTVTGTTLTLTAVVAGAATVTVTATDAAGLTATQVFGVAVGDRFVRAVLTDTLAALGRGHLSSVRQTVGRRLETGSGDTRRLTVAGQRWDPDALGREGAAGLPQTHAWLARAAALNQRGAATDLAGTSADPHQGRFGVAGGSGNFGGGWDQTLQGTDMMLAFGDGGQAESDAAGGRRRWTVWGQGDLQTFRGTPAAVQGYEGDLRTAYLGIDAQLNRPLLLGVAVARSGGRGTWQTGTAEGRIKTALTTVYPYLRWGAGDTTVWAVAGVGRGTATLARTATGRQDSSPLSLGLGLVEARRRLATVGRGLQIGLRGEASWAQLATGAGDETIDALRAGVRRLRGGIEVTKLLTGPAGLTWTPFGALSTRHDAGAGQTGVGLEVAGGVRLRGGRVQVEAQGRRLVLHSATGYTDQGVSLAASVGAGPHEPGLTLSVRPTWGASAAAAQTLWQEQIQSHMQGGGHGDAGVDARVGYGLHLPGGGLLTPFGGFGQRAGLGRRLQLGARVGTLGRVLGVLDSPVQLELTGERYVRPGRTADHRFSMLGVVTFGARNPETWKMTNTLTGTGTVLDEVAEVPPLPEPLTATALDEVVDAPALPEPWVGAALDEAADGPVRPEPLTAMALEEAAGARAEPPAFTMTNPPGEHRGTEPPTLALVDEGRDEPGEAVTVARKAEPVAVTGAAVAIRDDDGSNRPPAFSAGSYAFDLLEPRGGLAAAVPLGAVMARDPDHGPVTYALAAGDWRRFAVGASSGAITYVGPPDDLVAGPRQYELTVTARDNRRLTEAATVVVTVVSVSEAPDAVDDAARTREDEPVVVDVLANDRGPAGDRLQIVAVGAPAHGIATVTDGRVRYVPAPDYHGSDAFSYTVAGRGGLTQRATVSVTVAAVDEAPAALNEVAMTLEDAPVTRAFEEAPVATTFENAPAAIHPSADDTGADEERLQAGKRRRPPLRHVRLHHRR